jgi:hypothetical protein
MKKYNDFKIGDEEYFSRGFWGDEKNGIHLIPKKYTISSIGKKIKVVEYWAKLVNEMDIGTDWDVATWHCWRCGRRTPKLELAHIIPKALTDKKKSSTQEREDNLVLLCAECHAEAPDVLDTEVMWDWIKRTSKSTYGEFRFEEVNNSFEQLFGENMLNDYILSGEFNGKDFVKEMNENMKTKGNSHAGKYSASTMAWLIKETFKTLKKGNQTFW